MTLLEALLAKPHPTRRAAERGVQIVRTCAVIADNSRREVIDVVVEGGQPVAVVAWKSDPRNEHGVHAYERHLVRAFLADVDVARRNSYVCKRDERV